jgi:hypothetical protein
MTVPQPRHVRRGDERDAAAPAVIPAGSTFVQQPWTLDRLHEREPQVKVPTQRFRCDWGEGDAERMEGRQEDHVLLGSFDEVRREQALHRTGHSRCIELGWLSREISLLRHEDGALERNLCWATNWLSGCNRPAVRSVSLFRIAMADSGA